MIKKTILFLSLLIIGLFQFVIVNAGDDITKESFTISVNDIAPGATSATSGPIENSANSILENIIDSLIVSFGVLSLIIMSIGAGYMIVYSGQDELLSKGKKIFTGGLISLVVALLSGMIVTFLQYLLYK